MYQGMGALPPPSVVVTALARAINAWSPHPMDPTSIQDLYVAAVRWAQATRPRWTQADKGLALSIMAWASDMRNPSKQQLVRSAFAAWRSAPHALSGMGEYFAPAAGVGEYFQPAAGMGEYFQGTGAVTDPGGCPTPDEVKKYGVKMGAVGGAVGLGLGLFAAMVVFR
jgi:hypothetical protein